jgi:hypothetical protein
MQQPLPLGLGLAGDRGASKTINAGLFISEQTMRAAFAKVRGAEQRTLFRISRKCPHAGICDLEELHGVL